jgi:hypothetical protein
MTKGQGGCGIDWLLGGFVESAGVFWFTRSGGAFKSAGTYIDWNTIDLEFGSLKHANEIPVCAIRRGTSMAIV